MTMPATSRPPLRTSSMANSSATRSGGLYSGRALPMTASLQRRVRCVRAAAIRLGEGIDVGLVQVVTLGGVVEGVGHPHPGGVVLPVEVGRQVGPGHQVEEVVL